MKRKGYSYKVDVQDNEKSHELHNALLFLPKRIKNWKCWEVCS